MDGVAPRDWRSRAIRHTREVRAETVPQEVLDRITALELRAEQLIVAYTQLQQDMIAIGKALDDRISSVRLETKVA